MLEKMDKMFMVKFSASGNNNTSVSGTKDYVTYVLMIRGIL